MGVRDHRVQMSHNSTIWKYKMECLAWKGRYKAFLLFTERSQHKHTNNEPNPIEGISAALSLSDECTTETWARDRRECRGP